METVRENFRRWNDALLSRDPSRVAMLYSSDSSFHPTVDHRFRRGIEEAEDYFKNHFIPKNPSGEVLEEEFLVLADDAYYHAGLYDFEVDLVENNNVVLDASGKTVRVPVNARFTFVWKKDENGDWKIVHHHSSRKPPGH